VSVGTRTGHAGWGYDAIMERRTTFAFVLFLAILSALPAQAQTLNGNATLQGSYSVRYLGVQGYPCDCPVGFSGTLTFDGKGAFQVSGQGTTNNSGDHALTPQASGTYSVWSNGVLTMTNPFAAANSNTFLYGGVGQGAIVASSTDTQYLDILVGIPVASGASNATLSGAYYMANMEFASGSFANTRNAFSTLTADGAGGLGSVTIKGSSTSLNGAATTQTSAGATYTVTANGSGTLNFPAPSGVSTANQLLSGNKTLYVSADGSLFVAGSPTGYDFEIGIKRQAGNFPSTISGLFYTAELENCADCGQNTGVYAYEGSFNEIGGSAGTELDHLRVNIDGAFSAGYNPVSYDQTYNQNLKLDQNGFATDTAGDYQLGVSANQNFLVVIGGAGDYYLQVGVKTIPVTGTGVFLSPYGVVNGASFAPFTAQLSPGEVITLFGSGLSNGGPASASAPFPNTLNNVQVLITPSGATAPLNAPVYSISQPAPGQDQISAVVPYTIPTSTSIVSIQVSNGGTLSNVVQAYMGSTSPGLFTQTQNGLGDAKILHAPPDNSPVTAASPAKVGETVQVFLVGLGAVSGSTAAGAAAPSAEPLARVTNMPDVYIDNQLATVTFAGLAPGLGGLYQINVTIPAGVGNGSVSLEISDIDSDNVQATIPIAAH
jgi:uncharacterized protein (TIGR03437 family)